MVINTNCAALTGARLLSESSSHLAKSLSRLSSGSRLISPEDDAAGLAVSMRLDSQISRTGAAISNLGNATSFCQTQDGYLKKVGKALDRMSELAVLAQDVTKTDADRTLYNSEFQTLHGYITSALSKDFNGVSLFGSSSFGVTTDSEGGTVQMSAISATYAISATPAVGPMAPPTSVRFDEIIPGFTSGNTYIDGPTIPGPFTPSFTGSTTLGDFVTTLNSTLQSDGAGSASYNPSTGEISVTITPSSNIVQGGTNNVLSGLGLHNLSNFTGSDITMTATLSYTPASTPAPDILTSSGAASALTKVKTAIGELAANRATVGAAITRLGSTSEELAVLKDNLNVANSRIKDVDVAEESSAFARCNILVQAGTAMLAQANSMPSSVLKLLG